MWVSGQRHAPASLSPLPTREREAVTLAQEARGGPRAGLGRCGKYRASQPGFDPRSVQTVQSHYTD